MAAGGPAGKTRATRWGIGTARPAASLTVAARVARGASAAADSPTISVRRLSIASVYRDHHATSFNDRVGGFTGRELHFVGGLVRDRRGYDLPTNVDAHMRGCRASFDLDDLAFKLIASTEFHGTFLLLQKQCFDAGE